MMKRFFVPFLAVWLCAASVSAQYIERQQGKVAANTPLSEFVNYQKMLFNFDGSSCWAIPRVPNVLIMTTVRGQRRGEARIGSSCRASVEMNL